MSSRGMSQSGYPIVPSSNNDLRILDDPATSKSHWVGTKKNGPAKQVRCTHPKNLTNQFFLTSEAFDSSSHLKHSILLQHAQ